MENKRQQEYYELLKENIYENKDHDDTLLLTFEMEHTGIRIFTALIHVMEKFFGDTNVFFRISPEGIKIEKLANTSDFYFSFDLEKKFFRRYPAVNLKTSACVIWNFSICLTLNIQKLKEKLFYLKPNPSDVLKMELAINPMLRLPDNKNNGLLFLTYYRAQSIGLVKFSDVIKLYDLNSDEKIDIGSNDKIEKISLLSKLSFHQGNLLHILEDYFQFKENILNMNNNHLLELKLLPDRIKLREYCYSDALLPNQFWSLEIPEGMIQNIQIEDNASADWEEWTSYYDFDEFKHLLPLKPFIGTSVFEASPDYPFRWSGNLLAKNGKVTLFRAPLQIDED